MKTDDVIDPGITAVAEALAAHVEKNIPKQRAVIYTDGSCIHQKRVGGWAAHIDINGQVTTLSGAQVDTTNNAMELTAIVEALKALRKPTEVLLYSDSKYCVDAIAKRWINTWSKNGWHTSGWKKQKPQPIKNKEIIMELFELLKIHKVTAKWVKAHNGDELNEIVDDLAQSQARSLL